MRAVELRRDLRLLLVGTVGILTACQSNKPLSGESDTALGMVSSDASPATEDPAGTISPGTVSSDAMLAAEGPAGTIPAGRACGTSADCSWWQDPDPLVLCCGGGCTNTRNDADNCGGCSRRCGINELCANGACISAGDICGSVACEAGLICCGGACVRPYNNSVNCGGCGVACRFVGTSCQAGVCCADPTAACYTTTCPNGQVMCGDSCRDLGSDSEHCGACDRACSSKLPHCVAGLCRR
jgi:Stigma-specific protein, Stig1